jgi:hypothetical protein
MPHTATCSPYGPAQQGLQMLLPLIGILKKKSPHIGIRISVGIDIYFMIGESNN